MFFRGILDAVRARAKSSPMPHFFYEFDVVSNLNFAKMLFGGQEINGSSHADELGYLFRNKLQPSDDFASDSIEIITQRRLLKLWTNFAKTGNPTPEVSDLLPVKWEQFTPEDEQYLYIGNTGLEMRQHPLQNDRHFFESLWKDVSKRSSKDPTGRSARVRGHRMVETEADAQEQTEDVKEQVNGLSKEIELREIVPPEKLKPDIEKGKETFERADFEKAIELTGYGKFHYILLAVCGFVSTSEEMDVISMSFILPSAQCDLKLSTQTKGWLNSIIFIGMMVGAYAWGSVADSLGRKKVLIAISIMNALCIVASSFSQNYELFMLFRFLNGAALGGSGPVIWSYFAEFQPKDKRGAMLSFMAAFWTLGNLFVAGLAWLIIPSGIGYQSSSFVYNSWRIFLLICALPSFIVAILLFFLPESPKFLLSQGKHEETINIFRRIYHSNTGNPEDTYQVKELIMDFSMLEPKKDKSKESGGCSKFKHMMSDVGNNSKQLFIPPILRFTLISIIINFTFHIGYYGLMMWFPELFNRFDEFNRMHPGEEASVCEVTEFVVSTGSHSDESHCSDVIESKVFMESLITVASAIPSNIIAVLGMDRLGRKFFLVFSTFTSGLCAVGMYFVYNSKHNLIVSAVFSSVISCGNAALDCLITEVFPTNLRATGVAISMVAARLGGIIGNIVIATLLDMYCPAPTFIVAGLLIGGGLLCLFLPNTTREPLS